MVSYKCSIYDVFVVLILSPVFLIRLTHFIFDRFVFRDKVAVVAVDSFAKEFRYV